MEPSSSMDDRDAWAGGRRIVLTTFGSLGDLYPYIALARGLQARGHRAVIATSCRYREKVESSGIAFHPVRLDGLDLEADRETIRRVMDPRRGGEYLIRRLLLPSLRRSYDDIHEAAKGADLLVSQMLTFATGLVAEKLQIPWASSFLQPLGIFSAYDPPVLPQIPGLLKLRFLGPGFHRPLFGMAERGCRSWGEPWHRLRAEVGLPPVSVNPLMEGQHSQSLVLAMFSRLFADKQPDWPPQTVVAGFPFLDQESQPGLPPELEQFLDGGDPPIVFTLGSSAVLDAGPFYEHSAAAAKLLRRRAVLITGRVPENRPVSLPAGAAAFDYAPFSTLFPRAAAVVHPGGVGTTGEVMRSGVPMLVMPVAHDQFDNAARVTRLGTARTISRHRYSPAHTAAELQQLLDDPSYARRAAEVSQGVRQEDGVGAACDALEGLLRRSRPREMAVH